MGNPKAFLKELVYIQSVESSFGSFLPFLQTIFSRAGKQSIYMEQMQREEILEGYDSWSAFLLLLFWRW